MSALLLAIANLSGIWSDCLGAFFHIAAVILGGPCYLVGFHNCSFCYKEV